MRDSAAAIGQILCLAGTLWCCAAAASPSQPLVAASSAISIDLVRQIGGVRIRIERQGAPGALRWSLLGGDGAAPIADWSAPKLDPRDPMSIEAMRASARALAGALSARDPDGRAAYAASLAAYEKSLDRLRAKLTALADQYRGSTVFLTDALGKPLIEALHFQIENPGILKTPPPAGAQEALREDIAERKASILVYDAQSKSEQISSLTSLARDSGVPTVGLRETLPAALTWQQWKIREVDTVQGALNEASP